MGKGTTIGRQGTKLPSKATKLPAQADDNGFVANLMVAMGCIAGILIVAIVALVQTGEASSLFTLNKWLSGATTIVGLGIIPLYGAMIFLCFAGLGVLSFLRAENAIWAFLQGVGVAGALLVIIPSQPGQALPGLMPHQMVRTDPITSNAPIISETASGTSQTVIAGLAPLSQPAYVSNSGYTVKINIEISGQQLDAQLLSDLAQSGALRGKLLNEQNGEAYRLFRDGDAKIGFQGNTLEVSSHIPGQAATASLVARIEMTGYRIVESRTEASQGINPVWKIRLAPAKTPPMLQRLRRAYWF